MNTNDVITYAEEISAYAFDLIGNPNTIYITHD